MRERSWRSWWSGLGCLAFGIAGLGPVTATEAQTIPAGALEQLDRLIGNRVETLSILGTQSGASGGTYVSDVNDSLVDVFKITGRGDLSSPRPMGDSGVGWNLVHFSGWSIGIDIRLKF
jgi:hypothetical protein